MKTLQDTITARALTAVKTAQDLALDASKKAFDFTTVLLAGARNVAVEATKAWTQAEVKPAATGSKTQVTKTQVKKTSPKTAA